MIEQQHAEIPNPVVNHSTITSLYRACTLIDQLGGDNTKLLQHINTLKNQLQHNNTKSTLDTVDHPHDPANATSTQTTDTDDLFLEPLTRDLHYLRTLLLKIIKQHDGQHIANKISELVEQSSKYRHSHSENDFVLLQKQVGDLMKVDKAQNVTTTGSATHNIYTSNEKLNNTGMVGSINTNPSDSLPLDCLAIARALYELLSLANLADSHHRSM